MSTLTFLNAPMLWGLLLASIPIVIHLLFRRRFRRIEWAPMHYLKLSIQRNRRRIRIEQLLLLALRTFLILLLFFFVARPMMHLAGMGSWLGARSASDRFVVLDDSSSMGYLEDGESAFSRGKSLAAEMIGAMGPRDRLTVVLTSQPDAPLFADVALDKRSEVLEAIEELQPSGVHTAWRPTIEKIDALLSAAADRSKELTFITDLRRSGWTDAVAEIGARWAGRRFPARVFDVGCDREANVALRDLRQVDRLALANTPVTWEAVIGNDTSRPIDALKYNWIIDGKPTTRQLDPLPPGASVKVTLSSPGWLAGPHHVAIELADDDFPGDNRRTAVATVRQHLNMMLVNGEPSSDPLGGELDFLAPALLLGIAEAESLQVQLIADSDWSAGQTLGRPDLVVIANMAAFTAEQAQELRRLTSEGTGVMLFLGEQVDPDNYNQRLFEGADPLLPAALESIDEDGATGLTLEEAGAGGLEPLRQLSAVLLKEIKVRTIYQVKESPEAVPGVRVLARWDNARGTPAVIERAFGRGRLLLWTVAADKAWSDWPTEPSYVFAACEAAKSIAGADSGPRGGSAGTPLRYSLPAGDLPIGPIVKIGVDEKPEPLNIEALLPAAAQGDSPKPGSPTPSGAKAASRVLDKDSIQAARTDAETVFVLTTPDTRRPGLYKLEWQKQRVGAAPPASSASSVQTNQIDFWAVNPEPLESDLARISAEELKGLWGGLELEVIDAGAGDMAAVRGEEIWRTLATCLLVLLAVEAAFATWVGRQR